MAGADGHSHWVSQSSQPEPSSVAGMAAGGGGGSVAREPGTKGNGGTWMVIAPSFVGPSSTPSRTAAASRCVHC
ncbi:MAG: PEP-CTERM sorting domain-containing protein [Burkholderiaceae bacterium]|nr:PEP-CTERM sorting domain-containing protein [Burkholderiaceae bacterium]